MAAISPAFGSAYRASATNSHHGASHDRQPRRGGPDNSPGREPRDTDPHQHLLSPARAAQPTLLRRPLTHSHSTHRHPAHLGPIPVIDPGRRRGQPPTYRRIPTAPRRKAPNPARFCQIRTRITWQITVGNEPEPVTNETNPIPPKRGMPLKPWAQDVGARRAVPAGLSRRATRCTKNEANPIPQNLPVSMSSKRISAHEPTLTDRGTKRTQLRSLAGQSLAQLKRKPCKTNPIPPKCGTLPKPRSQDVGLRHAAPACRSRHWLHEKRSEPNSAELAWDQCLPSRSQLTTQHSRLRERNEPNCGRCTAVDEAVGDGSDVDLIEPEESGRECETETPVPRPSPVDPVLQTLPSSSADGQSIETVYP